MFLNRVFFQVPVSAVPSRRGVHRTHGQVRLLGRDHQGLPDDPQGYVVVHAFRVIIFMIPGELDHLPEVAFYMQGGIDDVYKKAEELAKQHGN